MDDEQRHIWHTSAPRPEHETTTGTRVLGIAFLVVATIVVVVALLLVVTGAVTTDAPTPSTPR